MEITNRQAEVRTLQVTPHTVSNDRSLLKHLIFMGTFDKIDPKATSQILTS